MFDAEKNSFLSSLQERGDRGESPMPNSLLPIHTSPVQITDSQFPIPLCPLAPDLAQLTIGVNVAGVQFSQMGLIDQIDQILAETGLDGQCLKLEITETAIAAAADGATELLLQLRKRQIQLCIDDFGTGYSSLSRLQRLPIDTLKIDRSFVSRMSVEAESLEIVRTIVALAHNLGMDLIAEGVETSEQRAQLQALECEYAQGYLFSKPLPAKEATALIASVPLW